MVPSEGAYKLKLYFMCDSYLGCDQEYDIPIKVAAGKAMDEDSDSDSDSSDSGND